MCTYLSKLLEARSGKQPLCARSRAHARSEIIWKIASAELVSIICRDSQIVPEKLLVLATGSSEPASGRGSSVRSETDRGLPFLDSFWYPFRPLFWC